MNDWLQCGHCQHTPTCCALVQGFALQQQEAKEALDEERSKMKVQVLEQLEQSRQQAEQVLERSREQAKALDDRNEEL